VLISVQFFAQLRLELDRRGVELEIDEPVTVRELIELIERKIGRDIACKLLDADTIRKGMILLIDGRNVLHLDGLATVVDHACMISIFPPCGGG